MNKNKLWYQILAQENKTAKILIYERIGENFWGEGVSAKQFVKDLQALDVDNIDLHINSPGGNVFDGNAIYNALMAHKAVIDVKIDGIAASIASVVAMSGDTVEMPENAMLMLHDPSGGVIGTAEDMLKMAEALDKIKTGLVSAYRGKSGRENDEISEMMTEETWLTAREALDYGFADKITERVTIQANLEDFSQYRNIPEHLISSFSDKKTKKENKIMKPGKETQTPEITLELIKAEHPEIAATLIEEGRQAGIAEGEKQGAKRERDRIKAVRDQLISGHEKLVEDLMWDGETTGEQAAIKVLAAEKTARQRALDDQAAEAPDAILQPAVDGPDEVNPDLPVEEKCKAQWDKDKTLREEFNGDFDAYLAAEKAMAAGRVKTIAKK